MVQRHTASECLRPPLSESLPTKCQQLKKGFGDCRRGMIDMRKRFRGNQPITFRSLEASENSGEGYQLYAGRSAFAGSVRKTDGHEPEPPDWREVENEKYRKEQEQRQAAAAAQADKKT